MNIALTKNEWFGKAIAIIIAILCFAANFYYHNSRLIFLCCLVLCGLLLLRTAKHKYLFIVFAFISTYVLFLSPYFLKNLSIGPFAQLNSVDTYQKCIYLFSVFLASLLFFFKDLPEIPVTERLPVFDNNAIFALNTVAMGAILVFGATGQTILEGGYGRNEASFSVLYSYYPIFFLASYLFSGQKPFRLIVISIISILFIIKSLMFGGRGSTISILLMLYLLFFDKRISFPILILFVFVGLTFFSLWAQFRGSLSLGSLSLAEIFSIGVSSKDKYTAVGNNQTDVFYASVRIITMVDIGLIDTLKRLEAFALFCTSFFVSYSRLPPLANLASYNLNTYSSMGGGLIFAYFYTFLSYFGVIFIGYLLNKIWNALRNSVSRYLLVYCILALVTINGWFAYNPITLFKLCVWGVLYVFALDVLHKWMARKRV